MFECYVTVRSLASRDLWHIVYRSKGAFIELQYLIDHIDNLVGKCASSQLLFYTDMYSAQI